MGRGARALAVPRRPPRRPLLNPNLRPSHSGPTGGSGLDRGPGEGSRLFSWLSAAGAPPLLGRRGRAWASLPSPRKMGRGAATRRETQGPGAEACLPGGLLPGPWRRVRSARPREALTRGRSPSPRPGSARPPPLGSPPRRLPVSVVVCLSASPFFYRCARRPRAPSAWASITPRTCSEGEGEGARPVQGKGRRAARGPQHPPRTPLPETSPPRGPSRVRARGLSPSGRKVPRPWGAERVRAQKETDRVGESRGSGRTCTFAVGWVGARTKEWGGSSSRCFGCWGLVSRRRPWGRGIGPRGGGSVWEKRSKGVRSATEAEGSETYTGARNHPPRFKSTVLESRPFRTLKKTHKLKDCTKS